MPATATAEVKCMWSPPAAGMPRPLERFSPTLRSAADNVRSGINTVSEDAIIDHRDVPIEKHFGAYQRLLKLKGNNGDRIRDDKNRFERIARDCGFQILNDLDADRLMTWLANRRRGHVGRHPQRIPKGDGRLRQLVREKNRLLSNPFANIPTADVKSDQRRKRRSLTEPELNKLLDATQRRPLEEALRIRRGKNKGKLLAKVRDEVRPNCSWSAVSEPAHLQEPRNHGARLGELASLTVGQLYLDGSHPFADLNPADEKNREGNQIPIRADLAAEMAQWITDRSHIQGCIPITGRYRLTLRCSTSPTGSSAFLIWTWQPPGFPNGTTEGEPWTSTP